MATANPKYPNATIVEALCEIHLVRKANSAFNLSRPLPFYMAVQERFPTMENVPDERLEMTLSPTGEPTHSRTSVPRLRFFDDSRGSLIQLAQDGSVLTFNVLKPYPGWEAMRENVESLWPKLRDILEPQFIARIGIRYINRIEKASSHTRLSDWLKPNHYLPEAVIASASPYNYQASVNDENGRQLNLRVGEMDSAGSIIFDIDVVWKEKISAETAELLSVLDRLHDEEWTIFEGSITDTFKQYLQGTQASGEPIEG